MAPSDHTTNKRKFSQENNPIPNPLSPPRKRRAMISMQPSASITPLTPTRRGLNRLSSCGSVSEMVNGENQPSAQRAEYDRFVYPDHDPLSLVATPRSMRLSQAAGMKTLPTDILPSLDVSLTSSDDPFQSVRHLFSYESLTPSHYCPPSPSKTASAKYHASSSARTVLDAPRMVDDYYARTIAWSRHSMFAVCIEKQIFFQRRPAGYPILRNATRYPMHPETVVQVEWSDDYMGGKALGYGTSYGGVGVYDGESLDSLRSWYPDDSSPSKYTAALAWNTHILSAGSKDGFIAHYDVRCREVAQRYKAYGGKDIAGLAWNPAGQYLAAGNCSGTVVIYDARSSKALDTISFSRDLPRCRVDRRHSTTVKALAWAPWQPDLLASGGGTLDGTIRFWSTRNDQKMKEQVIPTHAQITSLIWNPRSRELLSTHGYLCRLANQRLANASADALVHRWPSGSTIVALRETNFGALDRARVLTARLSPAGTELATAMADETIRIRPIFGGRAPNRNRTDSITPVIR